MGWIVTSLGQGVLSARVGASAAVVCALMLSASLTADETGQTPRPKGIPPPKESPDEELVKLDKQFPDFRFVEHDGPFIYRGNKIGDVRRQEAAIREQRAYEYVLEFARRQPLERLRKYSEKNVPIENLYRPIGQDYLRELLHIEGKLALITALKPTEDLQELSGIEQLFEVWLFAKDTNKLVCVVVSELPEGLKPGENFDLMVAFDAYFFKLWHYESRQRKEDSSDPDKRQWQRAPLFLGKTVDVLAPVEAKSTYSPMMLLAVAGGLGALGVVALVISLWFRKGDQQVRATTQQKLNDLVGFENASDNPDSARVSVN